MIPMATRAVPKGSIATMNRAPPTSCNGSCAGEEVDRLFAAYSTPN
jgi:hypothetical protein